MYGFMVENFFGWLNVWLYGCKVDCLVLWLKICMVYMVLMYEYMVGLDG